MTKYQKYFQEMLEENSELFAEFKLLHDKYAINPEEFQSELNNKGEKILEIIRTYEKNLCLKSTSSQYGKFASNLSEKFWDAVRGHFSKIDFIGVQ